MEPVLPGAGLIGDRELSLERVLCISESVHLFGRVSTDVCNGCEILMPSDIAVQRRVLTLFGLVYVSLVISSAVFLLLDPLV